MVQELNLDSEKVFTLSIGNTVPDHHADEVTRREKNDRRGMIKGTGGGE